MALRPGKCYRKREARPYTRISRSRPEKRFIKGGPEPKIQDFEMGDPKKRFKLKLYLCVDRAVQIRHNALESARIAGNKFLIKNLGEKNYLFKILVYPHHVMRENPIAIGAGADRVQDGMKNAFGKPIGKAVRMKENQPFAEVRANDMRKAKEALKRTSHKLPTPCSIIQG